MRSRVFACLLAAALLLGLAPRLARAGAPVRGEVTRLSSGLRLVLQPEAGTGIAAVCSSFPAGTARDGAHQGELARLVAETVREGGRRSRDAEYSRVLESRGGSARVFLGSSRVEFCTEVPAHELPLALWLESGRHGPYAFTQANFDERRQEISLGRDEEPLVLLAKRAYELAFPGLGGARAPAGVPLLEQARRFHLEHYRLDRAVLSIAGDFDTDAIRSVVEEHFAGSVPAAKAPELPPAARQTSPRYMSFEDRALIAPLHARAWAVPGPGAPDHAALEVAAELLAGNSDSVLDEMLLEAGIARAISHRFEHRGPEDLLLVSVELASSQNATDLVVLLDEAVQRLATGPMRPEQLARARRRLALARAFSLQRALDRARWLAERASIGADLAFDADQSALEAVSAEDVRRAVLAHLAETKRVVVELLPREARDPFRVAAPRFHVVTEGEALSRIARREGTTVAELLRLNELDKKGRIRAGQKLKLPPGKPQRTHTVKKGDTLLGIAKRYKVSVDALRRENRLTNKGGLIRPGQQLRIPRD